MRTVAVRDTVLPARGLVSLLGGTLLLLSMSSDFSYANLNTYVISYLRQDDPDLTYADWQWLSTTKLIVTGALMPFAGQLTNWLGLRPSVIAGCILLTGGYAATYWALDVGLWLVIVTLGVSHGVAFTLTYAQAAGAVMKWFPGDKGFMTSFAVAGYGLGGAIWNPIETAFVNPDNVAVEEVPGEEDKYFLDEDLLERVPYMFLLLAGCFASLQVIALLLLREPSESELKTIRNLLDAEKDLSFSQSEKSINTEDEPIEKYSVKPTDTIKTKEFYLLWFTFFSISISNGLFNNYAKAYGQIYISDDAFFAAATTASQVVNGLIRILWGKVYDKMGFQFSLFVIGCLMSFICFSFVDLAAFPEDSTGAKVFYATWIIGAYAVFPGIYSCFTPVTMDTFGAKHYSSNYGLLFTMNIAYSLLLLLMTIESVFDFLGYSGFFILSGIIGLLGLITTYLFPENVTSESYRARFEDKGGEGRKDFSG